METHDVEQTAYERVRRRSAGIEEELLAEEGGALEDLAFAAVASCTVAELLERAAANQFFFIEYGKRRYWPRWQLGLFGLTEILPILAARGATGFSVADFFLSKTDALYFSSVAPARDDVRKDDSPLKLLQRTGAAGLKLVIQHAGRFGEQGAL